MENQREDIINSPIVIDTILCKDVVKTHLRSSIKAGIVFMIAGLIFIVYFLVFFFLEKNTIIGDIFMPTGGGVLFGIGLMSYSISQSTIKRTNYSIHLKFTFYNDYFMTQQFEGDEIVGWSKTEYKDCQNFTVLGDYVFLMTKRKNIHTIKNEKNIVGFLMTKGLQCTASIK